MSVKKNYIYNVSYQLLNIVIPLVTIPYISRALGADGIGTVSYAESLAAYFTLFANMGISIYGQREISYVQDSKEERSRVFWETKMLSFVTSGIALAAYLVFAGLQEARLLYQILALNILAVMLDVSWFFQGLEEFRKTVSRSLLFRILNLLYIFTFVKTDEDIVHYTFALAFFTFAGNSSLWWDIRNYINKPNWSELRPFRNLKVVISLFIPTVAIQVYTVLDKTMIGMITNDSYENGYYELAIRMSKLVLVVVTSLGTVMVPRIGQYFQKQEHEQIKELMYKSYRFVWFLGMPLTFGLIAVSENFVPWFFGEGYLPVVSLLKLLAFLILAIGISNVTGIQYLVPTKRQQLLTYSVVIGAVINFCMNLILIPKYGATGAAIASLTAEVLISVVQLYYVRKELSIICVVKCGLSYAAAAGIMTAGIKFVSQYLAPSIIGTSILVVCGVVIYFGVLYVLQDEFLQIGMALAKRVGGPMWEVIQKHKEKLFLFGYLIFTFADLLELSVLGVQTEGVTNRWLLLFKMMRYGAYVLALVKIILLERYTNKEKLIYAAVMTLLIISWRRSGSRAMVMNFLIFLLVSHMDADKVVKVDFILKVIVLITMVGLSQVGILEDYVLYPETRARHGLGFSWPTTGPILYLFIMLEYIYLKKGKLRFFDFTIMFLLDLWFFKMCDAKMALVLSGSFLLFFFGFGKNIEEGRLLERIKLLVYLSPLSIAIGAILLHKSYDVAKEWTLRLNTFLNGRIQLGSEAINRYGFSWFGQPINWIGGVWEATEGAYNYVDCSYLQLMLEHGTFFLGLVLLVYTYIIWKALKGKSYYCCWIVGIILIFSITEPRLINTAFNVFPYISVLSVKQGKEEVI